MGLCTSRLDRRAESQLNVIKLIIAWVAVKKVMIWVNSAGKHARGRGHITPIKSLPTMFTLSWKQYSCGFFLQESLLSHRTKVAQQCLRSTSMRSRCWQLLQVSQVANQSGICGSHGGPTGKMTVLERPDENILVPETSAHLQGRGWVHTLMAWAGCFLKHNICS